ncbi:MAG: hypothetical protein JST19_00625 [Bacteroidetes bacterium]|nr:hypothetical protein [Bacteroidota bacterium]
MLGEGVKKLLDKSYPASSIEETTYRGQDIAFKTDKEGRPVLVFIGKKIAPGKIRGERYVRSIVTTSDGKVKDHWERKGKATP